MEPEFQEPDHIRRWRIRKQERRANVAAWATWLTDEMGITVQPGPRGLVMLDPEQLAELLEDA